MKKFILSLVMVSVVAFAACNSRAEAAFAVSVSVGHPGYVSASYAVPCAPCLPPVRPCRVLPPPPPHHHHHHHAVHHPHHHCHAVPPVPVHRHVSAHRCR